MKLFCFNNTKLAQEDERMKLLILSKKYNYINMLGKLSESDQMKFVTGCDPDSWFHKYLAFNSQHLEIQQQLLDRNKPDSSIHWYLASYSQHLEIQQQLLDKNEPDSYVYGNLYYSQYPEIQKQVQRVSK